MGFGPLDESPLFFFNSASALALSGIMVWSCRSASAREVSG